MNKKTVHVVSVGVYQREQWSLLLETADDRHELEDTYDEWTLSLENGLKNIRAAGIEPLMVEIDVHELLAWCKVKDEKNTGEARAEFIAELCRQGRGKKIESK